MKSISKRDDDSISHSKITDQDWSNLLNLFIIIFVLFAGLAICFGNHISVHIIK